MSFFESPKELIDAFGDIGSRGFYDARPLQDVRVGFSVKHNYPDDIRYKPAIGQASGKPDNVAVIWVVYSQPEMVGKDVALDKAPLRIKVANVSRYRSSHFDYDYDDIDGDSPTRQSVEQSLSTPRPIELEYQGKFFYNHARGFFFDENDNPILGRDLLDKVFREHYETVHLRKGLLLRLNLSFQNKLSGGVGLLIDFLEWVLKGFFGRSISSSDNMAGFFRPYKLEDLKRYDEDTLDLLGYKASKSVIILFCGAITVFAFLLFLMGMSFPYFSKISKSEFLVAAHGIFVLWIVDVLVPIFILWLINGLIRLRYVISSMGVGW